MRDARTRAGETGESDDQAASRQLAGLIDRGTFQGRTRLTNAFSKKLRNHRTATALHFAHYNLVRRHQTTRVTPAMAAGVTNEMWSMEQLLDLRREDPFSVPVRIVNEGWLAASDVNIRCRLVRAAIGTNTFNNFAMSTADVPRLSHGTPEVRECRLRSDIPPPNSLSRSATRLWHSGLVTNVAFSKSPSAIRGAGWNTHARAIDPAPRRSKPTPPKLDREHGDSFSRDALEQVNLAGDRRRLPRGRHQLVLGQVATACGSYRSPGASWPVRETYSV